MPELPAHAVLEFTWITPGSLIFAIIFAGLRWYFSRPRPHLFAKTTRGHFLDGIAVGPMLLLAASPLAPGLADALLKHDGLILAAAGLVAVLAVLEPDGPNDP